MKITPLFSILAITIGLTQTAIAQTLNPDQCFPMIQQAELNPDPAIYDQCGFSNPSTATTVWAPIAQEHKLAHALYEICTRHPNYPQSQHYCLEAAKMGDGPAVAWAGDFYYQDNQIPKAMSFYNYALQRGGLTEEREGKILANLGILHANPDSQYYNIQQAMPLLKKAALQRSALANNILGVFTFLGENGLKYNQKEAFAYFWRAILLGCPAAEENLGFLHLVRQGQLNKNIASTLMSSRIFSCEKSPESEINLDDTTILVYHLSFSAEECADLNYYAERLVDSRLPFTGKQECGFSGDMTQMANYLKQRDTARSLEKLMGIPPQKKDGKSHPAGKTGSKMPAPTSSKTSKGNLTTKK